jgi:hypothetical protein
MNYENENKEAKRVVWGICFESPISVCRPNLKLFSFKGSISGRLQHRCLLGHEKADNQTEKSQDRAENLDDKNLDESEKDNM